MTFARVVLCFCLVLVSSAGGADAPEGENLAPNPSFEASDASEPAFWSRRTPNNPERALSWCDKVARTGARSLRIRNRADVQSRWRTGHHPRKLLACSIAICPTMTYETPEPP
jgi:hypothetical protein